MKPSIEIMIAVTGEITIDAVGFTGADCEQATRFLEEVLGTKQKSVRKAEFYRTRQHHLKQRIGG